MSRNHLRELSLVCLLFVLLPNCKAERWEGQHPGECNDAGDNDQDGLFDCDDTDCTGAPNCLGDDDSGDDDSGDDDDSALGPCRPVDHLWDPLTEPLRLPCETTYEPCNGIDDDLDGFLDPKCGTETCVGSADCTMGGLMPDADCNQNSFVGPVCTWIDGVPPLDNILDCMGMLCPPGLKCVQGDCVVPGTGLPHSSCTSGLDCPINSGCLSPVEEGDVGYCTWFCHDFPCPDGFVCGEFVFDNPHTGTTVRQMTCDFENAGDGSDSGEGSGPGCTSETCPECEDGQDNDGDGAIDCIDQGCVDWCGESNDPEGSGPGCTPTVCPDCKDGIDNDGDGTTDCDDDGCADYCP